MAVKITYTARGDKIRAKGTRFVRACYEGTDNPNSYYWCIRDDGNKRYDLQQGTCDAEDLPEGVRLSADVLIGHAFSYVEWPR